MLRALSFSLLAGLLALALLGCKVECSYKKVAAIGACNAHGYCGVAFDDGSYGSATRPVVGQKVETECYIGPTRAR